MATRSRPRSARAASAQIVRIKLRLYPGEDEDLIAFFASIPARQRAVTVKRALRWGGLSLRDAGSKTVDEVVGALDALVE